MSTMTTDDANIGALMDELLSDGPITGDSADDRGYLSVAQYEKLNAEVRKDANVLDSDTPEQAAAKVRAETVAQFGPEAKFQFHPKVQHFIESAAERGITERQLAARVSAGLMTRSQAAAVWEARYGSPATAAQLARECDAEAEAARAGVERQGQLKSLEYQIRQLKNGE